MLEPVFNYIDQILSIIEHLHIYDIDGMSSINKLSFLVLFELTTFD